ncbi:MAG: hypothetical protein FWE59_06950, partial [Oscillospiraceae bacterium]|nr:hypothetical protein [Oscillospiraceae bacterium]
DALEESVTARMDTFEESVAVLHDAVASNTARMDALEESVTVLHDAVAANTVQIETLEESVTWLRGVGVRLEMEHLPRILATFEGTAEFQRRQIDALRRDVDRHDREIAALKEA